VQEATLAQVWKYEGGVFTVDAGEVERDDPSDPMRTAMRQMMGVFAQLERGMIRARMTGGRLAKAEHGGYAGFGSPQFGMRSVDRELVANPDEAATLARILELRSEGASLPRIVAALEAEGRPSKRGGRWHPTTVARVLQRAAA
jgi:DNA invertase Pin-like site-specific DNA recombinase